MQLGSGIRSKITKAISSLPCDLLIHVGCKGSSARCCVTVALCSLLIVMGCKGSPDGSERQMRQTVDSFAVSYFNWQYHRALHFCTPESKPWLTFAASQVTQEDIQLLRQETLASYEVQSIDRINDTTAYANIVVFNFMQPDSIGKQPHRVSKANFSLRIVLPASEKKWKVEITQLPRPKKNS